MVQFGELSVQQELGVKASCLKPVRSTVEFESSSLCIKRLQTTHDGTGSQEAHVYTGYSLRQRAVPDRNVEVRFSVVGGSPVCAVDRGVAGTPWVLVREASSPCYPYKEEVFHYRATPDRVRYQLDGPAWGCYVSEVLLDDEKSDGTGSVVPLGGQFESGQRVMFKGRGDVHLPDGAEGTFVGGSTGPWGQPGYARVRFFDSAWDLDPDCIETCHELAASKYTKVTHNGYIFEVCLDVEHGSKLIDNP